MEDTWNLDESPLLLIRLGRQRSVMVMGQRRIGKTSLLKELVSSMPPRKGTICGIFLDVSGLHIPNGTGAMSQAFFDKIVEALNGGENWLAAESLASRTGRPIDVKRLARDLNPNISLLDSFDRLLERLTIHSDGVIERIALFVDEFDRFVHPLLTGRRDEVDKFLWNIRSVVQRSTRVSLVLAGSGLQQLLMQNYDDALFGSIDQERVNPFNWTTDRQAIIDTFLPTMVRNQLCEMDQVYALCERASSLTGGHPMYLSLLASSAALLSRGKHLTPSFLNRVVDRIVQDGLHADAFHVDRKTFYAHIFESLLVLDPKTRYVCKLILAHIAERTTVDYPWLSNSEAIAAVGISKLVPNRERLDALTRLGDEKAVEIDWSTARVRISVPMTAAAIRQDASIIRIEVLSDLEIHQ